MTRRVIFKPAAVAEMEQAHAWYEQREAGLGDEFLQCVDACIALLQRNPEAYPVVHKQVRMALVRRFPYLVFYTLDSESNYGVLCFSRCQRPANVETAGLELEGKLCVAKISANRLTAEVIRRRVVAPAFRV